MTSRFIVVISCGAALLGVLGVQEALADFEKVLTARISGPELDRPIRLMLGDVFTLESDLAVVPKRLGAGAAEAPTEMLGPSYAIRYYVQLTDGRMFTLRQTFYPRASGGPVVFTPPHQRFWNQAFDGAFPVAAGWIRSTGTADAYRFLRQRGLPPRSTVSARASRVPALIIATLLVTLVALSLIAYRRRMKKGTSGAAV
jgi:hypothetical protein